MRADELDPDPMKPARIIIGRRLIEKYYMVFD